MSHQNVLKNAHVSMCRRKNESRMCNTQSVTSISSFIRLNPSQAADRPGINCGEEHISYCGVTMMGVQDQDVWKG